jgi:transposase
VKKRRTYTAEFKREAVDLVVKQGYTNAEAARNLGIRGNMLGRWRWEQFKGPQNAFPGSPNLFCLNTGVHPHCVVLKGQIKTTNAKF